MKNKIFLITGASSGIGKATANLLSNEGAKTILISRKNENLRNSFRNSNINSKLFYEFDLKNYEKIPQLLKNIANENGKLDGIFHSAGIYSKVGANGINKKNILNVFESSIFTTLLLAKGISSIKVRNSENFSFVCMSSVSAKYGSRGHSIYSASKAAIEGAIRSLASELAEKNIRVNAISAGAVKTEMHQKLTSELTTTEIKAFEKKHPLGFGNPIDIANVASFLLSNKSNWITGSIVDVDGGYLNL